MNAKTPFIAAVLGLSMLSAHAATVTQDQIQAISAGDSAASVVSELGQPANTPTWADGSKSMVYGMSGSDDHSQRAYIDVKNGKVTGVEYGNDGGDN